MTDTTTTAEIRSDAARRANATRKRNQIRREAGFKAYATKLRHENRALRAALHAIVEAYNARDTDTSGVLFDAVEAGRALLAAATAEPREVDRHA